MSRQLETKAIAEGLTPRQLCDKYNAIHIEVYKWFDCAFDYFGRTSTDQQTVIAQDIFNRVYTNKLNARPLTVEQSVDQLYCTSCERFLADRFVEGQVPPSAVSLVVSYAQTRALDARGKRKIGLTNRIAVSVVRVS